MGRLIHVWLLKGQRHRGFPTSTVGVFLALHSDHSLTKESISGAGWSPLLKKPVCTLCVAHSTFPEELVSAVSGQDAVTDPVVFPCCFPGFWQPVQPAGDTAHSGNELQDAPRSALSLSLCVAFPINVRKPSQPAWSLNTQGMREGGFLECHIGACRGLNIFMCTSIFLGSFLAVWGVRCKAVTVEVLLPLRQWQRTTMVTPWSLWEPVLGLPVHSPSGQLGGQAVPQ